MTDLSFCRYRSPLGDLLVGASPAGLHSISFEDDAGLPGTAPGRAAASRVVADVFEQLDRYFAGERESFSLPIDLSLVGPFRQKVLSVLLEVGYGELTSYGAIARRLGTSARAVGGAVGANPIPIVIPCHRVIASDGSLGGFSGGLHRKRALLELEGHDGLSAGRGEGERHLALV